MQKLDQIQKFLVLNEGEDATFAHPQGQEQQARLIKMRLNAPSAVNLWITPVTLDPDTGDVRTHHAEQQIFLAHVAPGFEQIQFYYDGSFCLNAIGGNVWLDTYDNTGFSVEASDPTSFAQLYEREERHPAILEMERIARHNAELLREQNRAELIAFMAELEKRNSANVASVAAPVDLGTTSPTSDGGTAAPVPSSATGGDPVANPPVAAPASGTPA